VHNDRVTLAQTPEPPYYAVIFTSRRSPAPGDGYEEAARRMFELASGRPGFLGVDSVREDIGITVSYWTDEAAIAEWKHDAEHTAVREAGRARWYDAYEMRVARVERAYRFERDER
jgi:heme-degrading monooxygenase HmoA